MKKEHFDKYIEQQDPLRAEAVNPGNRIARIVKDIRERGQTEKCNEKERKIKSYNFKNSKHIRI
jgi:hypothetical protein